MQSLFLSNLPFFILMGSFIPILINCSQEIILLETDQKEKVFCHIPHKKFTKDHFCLFYLNSRVSHSKKDKRSCSAFSLKYNERSILMLKSTKCIKVKRCYHYITVPQFFPINLDRIFVILT